MWGKFRLTSCKALERTVQKGANHPTKTNPDTQPLKATTRTSSSRRRRLCFSSGTDSKSSARAGTLLDSESAFDHQESRGEEAAPSPQRVGTPFSNSSSQALGVTTRSLVEDMRLTTTTSTTWITIFRREIKINDEHRIIGH